MKMLQINVAFPTYLWFTDIVQKGNKYVETEKLSADSAIQDLFYLDSNHKDQSLNA